MYYGLVNMCGSFTFFTICAQNTKGNPKTAKSQQRVDEQANAQNVHPLYLVRDVREQEYDSLQNVYHPCPAAGPDE